MRDALLQQPQRSQTFQPLLLNRRGEAGPPVPPTRGRIESSIPTTTDAPQQPRVKVTHRTLPDIRDRFGIVLLLLSLRRVWKVGSVAEYLQLLNRNWVFFMLTN